MWIKRQKNSELQFQFNSFFKLVLKPSAFRMFKNLFWQSSPEMWTCRKCTLECAILSYLGCRGENRFDGYLWDEWVWGCSENWWGYFRILLIDNHVDFGSEIVCLSSIVQSFIISKSLLLDYCVPKKEMNSSEIMQFQLFYSAQENGTILNIWSNYFKINWTHFQVGDSFLVKLSMTLTDKSQNLSKLQWVLTWLR